MPEKQAPVDDEPQIARVLKTTLQSQWYEVKRLPTAKQH